MSISGRTRWKTVQMQSICDIGRGASPRPILDPKNYGGGIPWIKISDATASGKFIKSTKETVTALGAW